MPKIDGGGATCLSPQLYQTDQARPASTSTPDAERIRREVAAGQERATRHIDHVLPDAAKRATAPIRNLTAERLAAMVDDMALLVRETTGLKLDTTQLRVALVSGDEAIARVKEDAKVRLGEVDDGQPRGPWKRFTNLLGEAVVKGVIHGAYLPSQQTLICVTTNVAPKGEDLLRSTLYHELIHVAQHQTYPMLLDAIAVAHQAMKQAETQHGKTSEAYLDARDTFNARMSFLEGHPTYQQESVGPKEFPWRNRTSAAEVAVSALLLLTRDGREKMSQYVRGARTFAKLAAAPDGATLIPLIYQNPVLVDVLMKTRGEVTLEVVPGADPASMAKLASALRSLADGSATGLKVDVNVGG